MAPVQQQVSAAGNAAAALTTYDVVPYDSHPFPQMHPLVLQGIAKIFGLHSPVPDNARILEIGCAAGANILTTACCYPNSHCVGIDYSQNQIEAGRKDVRALGLANLELKHMSVMDVDKSFGIFDYILCHGVFSWVSAGIQEKILEVCKSNLAPDGAAYISYNTLPGWNSVRSIRDMMLYYTAHIKDPAEKVRKARALLQSMNDSIRDSRHTLTAALQREVQLLAGLPDYYILHDHLEENSGALYFHAFMERAQAHGLQYLGDTNLETMSSGNLPEGTANVLAASDDIIRTEQYLDFVYDRRFRHTLLCHNDRILKRNVLPDALGDGWVVSRFGYPQGFDRYKIQQNGQRWEFQAGGELKWTTTDPLLLALIQVLMKYKRHPVRIAQLTAEVRDKLEECQISIAEDKDNPLERQLGHIIIRHLFSGAISFYPGRMPYVAEVSKKPLAPALARHQAKKQEWVSNQCQEQKYLIPMDRVLLGYLDGRRDVASLVECMMPHFTSRELAVNRNNQPVEDIMEIRSILYGEIAARLQVLCDSALLVG